MMITRVYIAVLAGIFLFTACGKVKKDVADYYPKVATKSIAVQQDGSVLVTGELLSSGAGAMKFVGFCMDTVPLPRMDINQILVAPPDGNGSFTATYKDLNVLKRYYVRSFALNEHGYVYGSDLVIENAAMDTNAIPCHPGNNVITTEIYGFEETETIYPEPLDSIQHSFSTHGNSISLSFDFARKPISGLYRTATSPDNGTNQVRISYYSNNFSNALPIGSDVYVWQVNPTTIKVFVCHAKMQENYFVTLAVTAHY